MLGDHFLPDHHLGHQDRHSNHHLLVAALLVYLEDFDWQKVAAEVGGCSDRLLPMYHPSPSHHRHPNLLQKPHRLWLSYLDLDLLLVEIEE